MPIARNLKGPTLLMWIVASATLASYAEAGARLRIDVIQTLLTTGAGAVPGPVFSDTGDAAAWTITDSTGIRLFVNDQIRLSVAANKDKLSEISKPALSPAGAHVALAWTATSTDARGDQISTSNLAVDGKMIATGMGFEDLTFSQDGLHFGYTGRGKLGQFVWIDGKYQPPCSMAGALSLSPDGLHNGYIAEGPFDAEIGKNPAVVVVDGKQVSYHLPKALAVGGVVFSSDSKHWAVMLKSFATSGSEHAMILRDGAVEASVPRLVADTLRFSLDSQHLAFAATADKTYRLYLDGKPLPEEYNYIFPGSVQFSPDGQHLACRAGVGPRTGVPDAATDPDNKSISIGVPALVVDAKPLPGIGYALWFAPDSHFAYSTVVHMDPKRVTTFHGMQLTLGDKSYPQYQRIEDVKFSPSSQHFALVGLGSFHGTGPYSLLMIDGVEYTDFADDYIFKFSIDDSGVVTALVQKNAGTCQRIRIQTTK